MAVTDAAVIAHLASGVLFVSQRTSPAVTRRKRRSISSSTPAPGSLARCLNRVNSTATRTTTRSYYRKDYANHYAAADRVGRFRMLFDESAGLPAAMVGSLAGDVQLPRVDVRTGLNQRALRGWTESSRRLARIALLVSSDVIAGLLGS